MLNHRHVEWKGKDIKKQKGTHKTNSSIVQEKKARREVIVVRMNMAKPFISSRDITLKTNSRCFAYVDMLAIRHEKEGQNSNRPNVTLGSVFR